VDADCRIEVSLVARAAQMQAMSAAFGELMVVQDGE
jgi:hypothetical protein